MKAVNVDDVLKILHKYGKYIFVTDEKRYSSMADEIANLKALEQEPCDDCISRQAVLDINEHHHGQMPNHVNHEIWKEIKALPSVTPKEKTGHWKPIEYDGYADGYPVWDVWECSKCGLEHNGDKESLTAFCPDCGAKMSEPQESEDKDADSN